MNTLPQYPTTAKNPYVILNNTTFVSEPNVITNTSKILYTSPNEKGSLFQSLFICAWGTNAQTHLKVWLNNGLDFNVVANNALLFKHIIPATTPNTHMAPFNLFRPFEILLQPKTRIIVQLGNSLPNTSISIVGCFLEY